MPLESTIVCLDNSEWMRNGDYIPTRMESQHDAANLLCGAKIQSNPESTVGVLSMAGRRVELLVSPTDDMGKILASLHEVPIQGRLNLAAAVQIAQLALKHRRNKHGGQRVVIFVGSPVLDEKKALIKVGKLLKKNNVAVDVISLGELDENQEKLQDFVEAANSSENSHLITVPAGVLPSDVLINSPVLQEGGAGMMAAAAAASAGGAGSGGGGAGDFGGIDPNLDPELAMALRVSMEEERARQEAIAKAQREGGGAEAGDAAAAPGAEGQAGGGAAASSGMGGDSAAAVMASSVEDEEERLLQQALAMSMADAGPPAPAPAEEKAEPPAPAPAPAAAADSMVDDEDEAMQLALKMSMETSNEAEPPSDAGAKAEASSGEFQDPAFVNQLLASLPGVDASDPNLQAALQQLNQQNPPESKDEDKDDSKK
eukprot:CAMPEP_0113937476 /NCGR_PEP_ID=MMETSP1339-20121228/4096_1 /TAXON_ID=94617 /ORGANISM="Fibrocapsa japonica" /LENGTH=428 /DNA_ID=CAMNT_0000940263 /DNA_START=43 /DNA_END=1329 /DNA_ORIENTATION=+ /assembly_acc=CAM_ASM_000762